MSIIIYESGMYFGPYPDEDCFELEKSAIYQQIKQGVMMAEFALVRRSKDKPPIVWLVEAKSSSPKPATQPNFNEFIEEIRQKLTNALHMVLAARLERYSESINDLPAGFRALSLQEEFKLVLVVNKHREDWLPPLQDELNSVFAVLCKTFGLKPSSVAVINDEKARSLRLIQS
ncbi:MAG: hypothetical protein ACMV0I_06745 [Pseudomonas sp.]